MMYNTCNNRTVGIIDIIVCIAEELKRYNGRCNCGYKVGIIHIIVGIIFLIVGIILVV